MQASLRRWLKISLFNLMLVAFIGVILRYKIAYSLPFIDQKFLLHAHSHFAFSGWITQALMTLLVSYLAEKSGEGIIKKYSPILYANLLTAYGMLFTFPFQGYGFLSISFSTLSIFVSYIFAWVYWRDLGKINSGNICHPWFKAAVIFNVVSSAGPFTLAFMMATKNIHQNLYLASVYFFLHFQYNGWFFFSCMGLLCHQFVKYGIKADRLKLVYKLFVMACVPAYFLSALWLAIPQWIYAIVILSVLLQIIGWILLVQLTRQNISQVKKNLPVLSQRLFLLAAIALSIKLCLQAGSVIPSLSKLAFGFRPIVIGYLHLVLLGVISLFIIAYAFTFKFISINSLTKRGLTVFTVGILLNEILLMVQGVRDLNYQGVPFINESLFIIAILLFAGILILNCGQVSREDDLNHNT
ncbi:MAG: hypothetical protein JST75_11625 [Bacteroidetes bacterium]|nr:hypothetical protein [Bacteroidota bacterium]